MVARPSFLHVSVDYDFAADWNRMQDFVDGIGGRETPFYGSSSVDSFMYRAGYTDASA